MKKDPCTGKHAIHICELSRQGRHIEISGIVSNPRHMCLNCGRVADSDKNLCNPESIDNLRPSGT